MSTTNNPLAALIASRRALRITDGRLQLAQAIAATTQLVKVNPFPADATVEFESEPPNLFDLKLDDVGINVPRDVQTLKFHLKSLLARIAKDIDELPDNPSMNIEQIALFVEVSLVDPKK